MLCCYHNVCLSMKHPDRNSDIRYEWITYNTSATNLILQYTDGHDDYETLLNIARPVNQGYSKHFGMNYLVVHGSLLGYRTAGMATYNKAYLLDQLRATTNYTKVLILDADAVVSDFESNLLERLDTNQTLLLAHRIHPTDPDDTYKINIGVSIWNLRHTKLELLLQEWKANIQRRLFWQRLFTVKWVRTTDQKPLVDYLKTWSSSERLQHIVSDTVNTLAGRSVKHFMRKKKPGRNTVNYFHTSIRERATTLQSTVDAICEEQFPLCRDMHSHELATSSAALSG